VTYIENSTATPAAIRAAAPSNPMANGQPGITAAEVKKRWEDGTRSVSRLIGHYRENCAFDAGDQWVSWKRSTNQLQDMPRDDERVRATVNRMISARRTVMAKLHRRPLVFEVVPSKADDATVTAANLSESIIGACARKHDFESIRERADLSAWLGGTAALCVEWDTTAGQQLGMLESGVPYGTGEVRVTSSAINEIAFPPGCKDARTALWWIRAVVMPTAEAKERYRMEVEPAANAKSDSTFTRTSTQAEPAGDAPSEKSCIVYTYQERPTHSTPGQIATVIGGEVVAGPFPWYYPFSDHLPVAVIKESAIEDHWAGMTVVSSAVNLQQLLNLSVSGISEHVKLAGNARLVMSAQAAELIEQLTDLPGEVIPVAPGDGVEPHWIAPPQLPNWLTEEINLLQRQMDDILGHQEISRGASPDNIESGVGLSILAEQADTPLAQWAKNSGRAWGFAASDILALYAKFVTEPRQARIDEPGMRSWHIEWTGADLMDQTEATVPTEAVTPRSRAAMQAMAVKLWELGMTKDPKLVAKLGDFPDQSAFLEALDPDYAKAERENHDLAIGQYPEPADFDDHAKHITCHNVFRKTLRYEQLPEATRKAVDDHVLAHENLSNQELATQAQSIPPFDQSAQAHQPPGSPGGPPVEPGFQVPATDQQPAPTSPLEQGGTGTPPSEAPMGPAGEQMLNPTAAPQGAEL
jgi:hypothetical protein